MSFHTTEVCHSGDQGSKEPHRRIAEGFSWHTCQNIKNYAALLTETIDT